MDASHLRVMEILRRSIADGCTGQEALERVELIDPLSKTTLASVASTRTRMRKDDPKIPTSKVAIAEKIGQLARQLAKAK